MTHQFDPNMLPDDAFASGALKFLVVGNRGRMLDTRRTPIQVVDLAPKTGHVVLRIEGFEDKGALWEIPFERVTSYQFALESAVASPAEVEQFAEAVRRLDRPFSVPCDPRNTEQTRERLARLSREAQAWLQHDSRFLAAGGALDLSAKQGSPHLFLDLQQYMEQHDLADLEEAFATRFVSNPYSGELVKGHRVVMAELGLVPYEDTLVRDPDLFQGRWSKKRRGEHVLRRLAFVRALFQKSENATVTLYRGLSFSGTPHPPKNHTFVSSSFDFDVARSCAASHQTEANGLIIRQVVPVERLFMTYIETPQMNRNFLEAEAVLLYEAGNPLF